MPSPTRGRLERAPPPRSRTRATAELTTGTVLRHVQSAAQADQEAVQEICTKRATDFIRTEISERPVHLLRDFQKKFWTEIQGIWRNPTPAQERWTRLLMVAATGTGKSNLIAIAPFAGARDRCLVGARSEPDHPRRACARRSAG